MQINPKTIPDNKEVKEYLGWRATTVTDAQKKNLINKLGDAICLKSNFVTYIAMSRKPEKVEDGKAYFAAGTKVVYFTLTNKEGQEFLPLFTSEEELLKWTQAAEKNPMKMLISFDDLAPVMITNTKFAGAVINPMTDNFGMTRELIASWTTRKHNLLNAALAKMAQDAKKE